MKVIVNVRLKQGVLDPQGKAGLRAPLARRVCGAGCEMCA